ncbi:2,3-dehydroadipyl-CoA hydratase, partial [Dietzia sp. IN118]|nr:2,3-dehydroadipyl-CoA hydratase [Dietzia sp. IN118]
MSGQNGHDDVVLSERRGAVAILRINRPEARNALNAAVFDALNKHLAELRT